MAINPLLDALRNAYARATISHPQLKAVTLAQWLLESGRATSDLAIKHLNFGGLKFRPEMKPFATSVFHQASDGPDNYCKFVSADKYIEGYWAFINRAPYKGWKDHSGTGEAFIRFIGPIYCPPNKNYADHVLKLVPEAEKLLKEAASPPPKPAPPPPPKPAPKPKPGPGAAAAKKDLGAIVLDPGHGGATKVGGSSPNNATSISGALEKTLALDFCNILASELVKQANAKGETVKVVMTRTKDVNVGISARAAFAGKNKAKLFLSLHFNGSVTPSARGPETFFRAKANGNINLAADMAFANKVHQGLLDGIKAVDPTVKNRGVKPDTATGPGALGTLNDAALGNVVGGKMCSAAYIEAEFITNPTVEKVLISGPGAAANQRIVMASVAKAMLEHIRTL
jgi:N-acetylmuramoyl-L-alanine amidase